MDADLLRKVARRLDEPRTFRRLAAAVRFLRSDYDVEADGPLAAAEMVRLTEQIDDVDRSERVRDELRFVGNQLDTLVREQSRSADDRSDTARKGGHPVELWPADGLSVLRSTARTPRAKKLVDQVLFRTVVHHLTVTDTDMRDPVLVVVGADELGRAGLEELARAAWSARVRLVYFFERLREDAADLLGGGDGIAVLMRLGNAAEAATAAEFIGRGHTFQLGQVARQLGRTVTGPPAQATEHRRARPDQPTAEWRPVTPFLPTVPP